MSFHNLQTLVSTNNNCKIALIITNITFLVCINFTIIIHKDYSLHETFKQNLLAQSYLTYKLTYFSQNFLY